MKPKKRDRKEILASEKRMAKMIDELKLSGWQGCILAPANGIAPIEKRIRIAYLYENGPAGSLVKRIEFYMNTLGEITIEKAERWSSLNWEITETYIFDETIVKEGGELERTIKTS